MNRRSLFACAVAYVGALLLPKSPSSSGGPQDFGGRMLIESNNLGLGVYINGRLYPLALGEKLEATHGHGQGWMVKRI